jgi:hypothetical protein
MKIIKFAGALAGVLAAGLITTGTAHADTLTYSQGTQAYWISPAYNGLELAVADGSTTDGTRVIQWPNDGGAEQKWFFDPVYDNGSLLGYMIRNDNSGLCMWTDDQAGDDIYQGICTPDTVQDVFTWSSPDGGLDNYFREAGSPSLNLDISGASYNWGADLDGWYHNGNINQDFTVTPTSS